MAKKPKKQQRNDRDVMSAQTQRAYTEARNTGRQVEQMRQAMRDAEQASAKQQTSQRTANDMAWAYANTGVAPQTQTSYQKAQDQANQAVSEYNEAVGRYNQAYNAYSKQLDLQKQRAYTDARNYGRQVEQSSQTNAAYYKDRVNYAVTQGDYKAANDWMEKMTKAPLTPEERQKASDFIDLRYRYDPLVREQQEAEQILRNPYSTTEQMLAAQQRLNAATERANSDAAYDQFRQSADYYKTQNAMSAFQQKGADEVKRASGNAGHSAQMDSYMRSQNAMLLLQQLYDALQTEGNTNRERMFDALEATKQELRRYGVDLGDLDESNFRTKLEQAMTEQGGKVKAMRAVLGQEGYDTDAIYENLNYERQLKDYQANQQAFMEWGKNAGFGDKLAATIASVPYSVYAKPIEGINSFLGMVGSGSVSDPNNYRPVAPQSSLADMIRSGITENTNGVDRFLYSGVTSALDSALNAFSFGGQLGLATMGLSAANTRANEILEKGGNAQQAFSGGLTSGVIEALTEIVSIENLIDFAQNTGSLRQLAKNVGLQMFTEGSEEIAGEVLDIIADASIMGNLSDNAQAVQTYVAQGMTLAEAKREVLKDNALQILESGASGAFSGGLSGGLASGAGYLANQMQQRADERRLQNTFYEAIGESVRDEDGLAEDLGAYAAEKGLKFRAGQVQEAPQAAETPENQSLRQRERQIQQQQRYEQKNQKANTKLGKSAGEALTKLSDEFRGKTVAASEARYTELTNKYKSDAFREQAQEAVKSSAAERYSGAKDLQTLEELHKDNVKGVQNKELLQAAEAAYRDKVYDLSTSRDEAARARQGARYANRSGEDINLTASYKADGQEITSQVKRISEQKGQVVLENGTEANIQDLEMDADTKDLLTRLSQSVQGEAANTVLAMVRGAMRSGTVVDGYRTMANAISVYDQGRVGNVTREQALSRTSLDGDLAGRLYDLGSKTGQEAVRDAQTEVDRQRTVAKKKGATGRRGSVDLSQIDTKSLDARQRLQVALATKIAEAVGVDVEFFASEAKGGRYQGEQGAYEVGKGKIRLDINAGRNYVSSVESGILRTMSHELTHFIQDYSPQMYSELKTFSMKTLTDKLGDEGLEDLINSKIDRESGLSRLDAEDEVIADACEMMLKDSSVIRELYEQNPDLAYKIREWLTRFLRRVSEAFGGPMSTEARALRDSFAEMQRLWDQGLKDAAAAHQDIGELTDANYDRHATRSLLTATGFRVELEGQQVVAYDQDGNRVTEVTTDHVKNSGYGNLIKYAYQSGTISRKDMNKQIEGLAELMNTILKAQDGPMVWAYSGAMMFSAIKSNSDGQYTTTVDFTTVCRKTVEMVKAMSHTMKKLGRGLTIDEITQLQDKVLHTTVTVNGKEEGGIVNCPVCYVFSRWAGIGKILDNMKTFQEKYKDSKYDDVETLNKAIADLKKAAKIEKLSDLRKILPELDDEYEKLGNENLQLKEDLDKARKERNRVKARKSSTAEEKAAAVQKVNEINNQIKQNKERMGVIESSLAPELSWLTTVRAYQDPNNKDRYLPNLDFMKNGYVPEDVLFDLDKGDVFAGTYTEAWKYRTGRGPSAGKAIVPYSDMRLGDLILGPGNNSAEGNNTFYEVSNEFTEKQQEAIIKAVQRMKAQNLIGGQRFQSTSDFRYEYGLDYLQSFLELQAIGGKMQTYTKIVEYAEMVASMGGDVNLSVMGLGSGLDENGILIYSSVTGIDPEAAKLITHKFDSAQTILVGINDAHIRAALDDTEIGDGGHGGLEVGFVIPYHASGASITKFIAKLVANLGEKWDRSNYRDYSDVQTDSVKTYPGMEGAKKADVEAATAALVNAMIVNPTNPTFKRSLTAEQKDWVRRALLREVRNSILTRTAPAAFVKNNGETDEDAARRFVESCRSLFEGTSEDIINRSFDELRSIERRAMQGDKDAIAEYESWSAGVMFDLYNKMWMDSSRDDTYGVKLSSEQAKTIMPHEYWNRDTIRYQFDKDGKVIKDSGNAYVNGFIFRSYCYALGLNPRFTGITTKNEVLRTAKNKKTGELGTPYGDFSDERGYWKTLIDRAMYDNQGRYRDQNAINVTKLSDGSMLKPEYGKAKYGDLMVQEPREDRAIKAANAFVEDVRKKEGKAKHSLRPVEAVEPKTNGWQRSATFDEVKAEHPTLFELAAEEADTRNPTQIKGTVRTYRKIYDKLKAEGFDGTILDASSGLGVGTEAGRNEYDFDVDDIEPFPDASYKPRYTDYSKLNKTYDVVISNAVLNVIPQDLRDAMVIKIGELLNPGGRAFINVRGDDVKNAKTKVAINEDGMEYFISDSGSYQKGFTPTELKAYLEDAIGDGFTVQLDRSFGKVSAVVTKNGTKNTARDGGKVKHSARERYNLTDEQIGRFNESELEMVQTIDKFMEAMEKTGKWYGNEFDKFNQEHWDYDFVKGFALRDREEYRKRLKTFLSKIDNPSLVRDLMYYSTEGFSRERRIARSGEDIAKKAKAAVEKVYDARIKEIWESMPGHTKLNLKRGQYEISDFSDLFYKLNGDAEVGALADRVFATAKKLPLKLYVSNKYLGKTMKAGRHAAGLNHGGNIVLATNFFNDPKTSDQIKASAILHEMIHACTSYALDAKYRNMYADDNMKQAAYQLDQIRINALADGVIQQYDPKTGAGDYGSTTTGEFVAELANPEFRAKLKEGNLWSRILDAIKRFFGIETKTTFDAANVALEYMLEHIDTSYVFSRNYKNESGIEAWERSTGKSRYSLRDDLQLADDEILMRMKESDVENPEQRKLLQEYQKLLREKEQIHDMLQQVKSVEDMLSGGALDENKAMQKDLQKRINKLNKRITEKLNIPLVKSLLTVERERVYKEGREKIGEIRENRKRQELRGRIRNLKDDLTKRMLKPSDQRFVPAELAKSMVAVLDAVDDSPAAGTKAAQKHAELGQRIREMSDAYADLAEYNDPTFQTEYNEEFAGELREIAKATQGRNLRDLTSDELQDVYDAVKTVRDKMRTATKLLNRDSTKNIYENANDIALQQAALKKYNAMSKAERSEVSRRLHHISAMRAVEYMAGSDRSSTLYQMMADVEQGVTDAMTYVMNYNKRFDHLMTGANERVWRKAMTEQKSYGFEDEDGNDVKLTRMQVMQLIMTWRREMANKDLTHLQKGGAVIRDAKAMLDGKTPTSQIIHPTAKQMAELENSLTAWERAYIDQVSDYFKNVEAKEMGRVVYKLQHRALKTEAAYVPYIVDSAYLESKLESAEQVNNLWIKTPGSTNDMTKMAPQPVIIDGLETVMKKHVSDSANYVNLALPIRDFSKVYNAKFADVNGTPYMPHTLIEENFGSEGDKIIRNALMEVQGVRGGNTWTTQIDEHLSMLQSAFVKSALLINPSVTIKQAASYLAAGSVLSRAALELGNRPVLSKTDASHSPTLIMQLFANPMSKTAQRLWDEIDSHTSMLYERRLGMLMGENMSQHAAVRKLQEMGSKLEGGKIGQAVRSTAQMTNMLNWIQRMDVATTTALWVACKEQARMDNLKPGTTAYWDRVTKLYERTLRETQPMYDTLHRSAAQKSDKGLRPYLFPFRTVPAQNHGQIVNAYEEMRAAKGTARQKEARRYFAKTIIANTESAIMFSALSFLAAALKHKTGRYRDKDDEMNAESAITGILMDSAGVWASNLMPMVGSELFNAIQKVVDKYVLEKKTGNYDAFSVGVVELLNDLIKASETLIDDGMNWIKSGEAPELKDFVSHLWTAAKSIAKTAGIPAQTMEAYVKGIVANVQDALNGRFPALNNESVDRTNTVNANRYYNALMNGNTEKAAAVLEEMRANTTGTKKEVHQKVRADIAARAKEAYKSGEIDLDGYLDFLADTGLWEPDALKSKTTETIKGLYNDGEISEDEAIHLLVDKNGFDEDDAWFKVQEWEDKAAAVQEALDAGLDADEAEPIGGSDYRRIYDAIDANQDIDQLVDELVEHGRQRDAILESVKDHIVEDYEDGKYTDRQLKELLARHCRITKTDEVNKILNSAKCYRETGHRLSNVRESVINGSLTRDEAQKILTKYGGDDIATAKNKARAYDFARQHPDLDWNVDTVTKYYDAKPDTGRVKKTPYGAGISVETYNTFLANAKGLTKKQEYIDAIAATPGLTDEQKELLLRLKYDLPKESDENKKYDIPWH